MFAASVVSKFASPVDADKTLLFSWKCRRVVSSGGRDTIRCSSGNFLVFRRCAAWSAKRMKGFGELSGWRGVIDCRVLAIFRFNWCVATLDTSLCIQIYFTDTFQPSFETSGGRGDILMESTGFKLVLDLHIQGQLG